MGRNSGLYRLPVFAAVAVLGCTEIPAARFDNLAQSTHTIQTGSAGTYAQVELLQRQYMVFNPSGTQLTTTSFAPVIDVGGKMTDFDFVPRMKFRETVIDTLVTYMDVLDAFANKDYQADLDKASQRLGASVSTLATHSLSDEDAKKAGGILAAAVNELGHQVIQAKKLGVLHHAMQTAQPGLESLCRKLIEDNDDILDAVKTMRSGIIRVANTVRPRSATIERLNFDGEIAATIAASNDIAANVAALKAVMQKLPAAHAEVAASLGKKGPKLDQLKLLIAEAKRLKAFYGSLSPKQS